jgi:hypothetical protein
LAPINANEKWYLVNMPKNELKGLLQSISEEISSSAREFKQEACRSWASSSANDREMRKIARSDEKAVRAIASLVRAGRVSEAYDKASCLDTVVRETIPDRFWEFAETTRRLAS